MDQLLASLWEGRGRLLLVRGVDGMGRRRFLGEMAARPNAPGRCLRMTVGRPGTIVLGPLDAPEAVETVVAESPHDLTARLRGLAAVSPTLVLFDDLRRASLQMLAVVDQVLEDLDTTPLLLVLAAGRGLGSEPIPHSWRGWIGHRNTADIELGPVTDEDIALIVESLMPKGDSETAAGVVTAARGNPGVALELCRWRDRGSPDPAALSLRELSAAAPLLTRVVCESGPPEVFGILSACGGRAPVDLVAAATGLPGCEVEVVLEAGVAQGLLRRKRRKPGPNPEYAFTHPLIRDIAEAQLGQGGMASTHRRVAYALERTATSELSLSRLSIAHHLLVSGERGPTVAEHCLAAAEAAWFAGMVEEADQWASTGLANGPETAVTARLNLIAGRCAIRSGLVEPGLRHLDTAVAIAEAEGDRLLLATGAVEYLHAAAFASTDVVGRDRLSLVRTAIQACPPDATALRAHLVAHHARLLVLADPAGHRTMADEAFRVARESGDSEALAFAREVSLINLVPQEIERYVTIGHELRQMPGRAVLAALPCLAYTAIATGRREALDGAYAQFAILERTHSDRRTRSLLAQILTAQALLDMDEPRLATALRAVHVESPTSEAFATHAAMALWRVHSGRSPRGLPADPPIPEGLPVHALLLSELVSSVIGTMQSDLTARRSLDRLIEKLPPLGDLPHDVLWSSWHAVAAVAAALTGAPDLCEDAVRALRPFWDQFVVQGTCVPVGPVGWYLAPALQALGRHAEALEANHRAEAVSQRLRSPVWLAQCLHQRGKLLRDHHPAIAEESLAQALHLAQSLSMDLLAERVAHTLTTTRTGGQQGHSARQGRSVRQRHQGRQEAAPVRLAAPQGRAGNPAFPPNGAAETVGGLTPAAVEILRHAGEGRTNEQISRIMHLSVATVERHLTNAYRVLGVRNRTQAVQALLRIDGAEATSK